MSDWTKPESYNAKTIAWTAAKERLASGEPLSMAPYQRQWAEWFPRDATSRVTWGGRRSGKTERIRSMGIDLARGPDTHIEAVWRNGRWWYLPKA